LHIQILVCQHFVNVKSPVKKLMCIEWVHAWVYCLSAV